MASSPEPTTDDTSKPVSAAKKAAKGPGRFTPKATKDSGPVRAGGVATTTEKKPAYANSGRYTAPVDHAVVEAAQVTKPWVPFVMFALLALGGLLIVLNYVGVLPSAPSNWYLLGGILAITGGFITATQLK